MKLRHRELKDLSRIIQLESHCPIELLMMVEISIVCAIQNANY